MSLVQAWSKFGYFGPVMNMVLRAFVFVVWIFGMVWIGGLLVQVYCLAVLISGLDLNKLQGLLCRFGYRFVCGYAGY